MESSSPPTSLTLLDRLRTPGQTDAWERFVRLYTPLLKAWAKRHGFTDTDADDLTQEILIKVLLQLPKYQRRDDGSFRGWLFELSKNQGHDFRRRVATRPLPAADGLSAVGATAPLAEMEEDEHRLTLVHRGLELIRAEFSEQTWTAFFQLAVQGLSPKDVARNLGLTVNVVYSARHRVLNRLRREIDSFLE